MMRILITISLFLLSSLSSAQTVIVADALFDSKTAKMKDQPRIVVEKNQITSITFGGAIPEGNLVDLSGHTIMPGFIDMHTHLTSSHKEHGYRRLASSTARSALRGVKHAKQTVLAGVTSVRNLGASGFTDVALRDAINDGDFIGPRMFVSGPSLGITGGHCDNNLLSYDFRVRSEGVADGPWEAAKAVRRNIKYGADVIKICATGGVLSKGTKVGVQQYSLIEMQKIVEEAHRRDMTVAAHAHGTEGIYEAIKAGVDSIEHASFIDEKGIKLAKQKGTYLSMDIYVTEFILSEGEAAGILEESLAKERKTGSLQRDNFRKAVDADVNMVMGTDSGVYPHGHNLKQLSRMVKFGMSPARALQTATYNGAKLLRKEDQIGYLTVGAYADVVAVKGDPLDDISLLENVDFVMKNGEIIKQDGKAL